MSQEELAQLFGKRAAIREKECVLADRSKVQQYAECPFQAWYCAEHDIDVSNVLMDVGSESHGIVEQCLKEAIELQIPPDEVADNILNALQQSRPDIQPHILKATKNLCNEIKQLRFCDIIAVEIQIDDAGDCGLRTIDNRPFKLTTCLDLLLKGHNSLHVRDWKSGFKKRTKADVETDFQAQFSCVILWNQYPDIDIIHWWFIETFWGTVAYARFDRRAEVQGITQEQQFTARVFSALRLWQDDCREAWPEEKKCAWCPIVLECPHVNRDAKRIAEDPAAFVDQMVATKAAYDKMVKLAKDRLQKTGPILGRNMVFEWRPSKKFTPKLYKHDSDSDAENGN